MQVDFRLNARPSREELDALSVAVGWSPFGVDYAAALDGYAVTTSAWTSAGRLVGWTSVVSDHVRHAFLLDVMVHPDFQRRGIGRQLVHRAIDAMRAEGVTAFHVDCAPDRAGFYERCGFKMCAGGWLDTSNVSTPLAASDTA
jgi:GNAT superfamily N-acetyltransferase